MTLIWIAAAFLPALVLVIVVVLPRYLVRTTLDTQGIERRRLQNEIVRTAFEVLGGAFLIVTAIFAWQEIQNSKVQIQNAQDQLEVARQGQVTERLATAFTQLASDQTTARVGAVFALERIARDSPRDHGAVMDVLAAFLREHAPVAPGQPSATELRGTRPPADVQAAITVLGRRDRSHEPSSDKPCDALGGPNFPCTLNLTRVDLTGADLSAGNFDHANLAGARLATANAAFASFKGADLGFSDLRLTNFRLADVLDASISFSLLESTNFHLTKGLTCDQLKSSRSGVRGAANLTIRCPP